MNIEIKAYIEQFDNDKMNVLMNIHNLIKHYFDEKDECIKYGIPTFCKEKNLIHYGGYKNHVGIYPGPRVIDAFKNELNAFKCTKGTIKMPWNLVDYKLIENITIYIINHRA